MMKPIKLLSVILLCLICASCASKRTEPVSFVEIKGNPDLIKKITLEIADLIQQEKSINETINLVYDLGDPIGDPLHEELKGRGFALSDVDGIKTTFVVTSFDATRIYLSVTMDKMMLSRIFIYEAQTGSIRPGTPLNKGEV